MANSANKTLLPNYDLNMTLLGGQSFAWDFEDNYYWGFTSAKAIKIKKEGDNIFWQTFPKNDDYDFLMNYLRVDVQYEKILQKISKDSHIKSSIKANPNLRLLKQDFEQTVLSFMISSNNTITSIRKSIRLLNKKLGRRIKADDREIYLFPETEAIASAPLPLLLETKIGFRAKFLKEGARNILEKNLPSKIVGLNESQARAELKQIKGVGNKIADCVMVFSLGFDEITPLDVWGKRVFIDFYGLDPKMKYEDMQKWIKMYFEGYGAWAGQFLFEYIRKLKK